jgi:hypothetical protein
MESTAPVNVVAQEQSPLRQVFPSKTIFKVLVFKSVEAIVKENVNAWIFGE